MTGAGSPPTVVIGVGNAMRSDDGAGIAVLEHLEHLERVRQTLPPTVDLVTLDGEPARLVEAWDGADLAVVVDAVRTGATPGTVVVLADSERAGSLDAVPAGGPGTHGAGVGEAVRLAAALDRLPRRLVVVGIEGASFVEGPSLSPPVAAAVTPAAEVVLGLLATEGARAGALPP